MIGRRIALIDGKIPESHRSWNTDDGNPWKPGDYIGPVMGYTGELPMVMFCLPVLDAEGHPVIAHVCSPPHVFRECADGSLEIRESILTQMHRGGGGELLFQWHGYLDEGHNWRTV